jgi:hypothetical protein
VEEEGEAEAAEDDWGVWENLVNCHCPVVRFEAVVASYLQTRNNEHHDKCISI